MTGRNGRAMRLNSIRWDGRRVVQRAVCSRVASPMARTTHPGENMRERDDWVDSIVMRVALGNRPRLRRAPLVRGDRYATLSCWSLRKDG